MKRGVSQGDGMLSRMVHSSKGMSQLLKERKTNLEVITKLRNGLPMKRGKS
jgi:hypothetical protein